MSESETTRKTKIYYYGGKFNPFTRGHLKVLEMLFNSIDDPDVEEPDNIVVAIGLVDVPSGTGCDGHHLCSSYEYRADMVRDGIADFLAKHPTVKVSFVRQDGLTYDFCKNGLCKELSCAEDAKIVLVLGQDEMVGLCASTSEPTLIPVEYLDTTKEFDAKDYPHWEHADEILKEFDIFNVLRTDNVSSSAVRAILRADPYAEYCHVKEFLAKPVFDNIKSNCLYWQFGTEEEYRKQENNFIAEYDASKYPRPCATVDLLVIGEDTERKILLIRRKNFPYKHFWALPGGFLDVNDDETLEDAAARELCEETSLDMIKVERQNQFKTYSDKGTDPRCRIVDTVYAVRIDKVDMEFAKADDDAAELAWFPVDELPRMAFNHKEIIEDYLAKASSVEG